MWIPFSGCQTLLPSQKFNMIHLRKWRQKGIGDSAFEKHHFMVPAVQLGSFSQPNLWWKTVLHNRVWCCHNMWQTFLVKKIWSSGNLVFSLNTIFFDNCYMVKTAGQRNFILETCHVPLNYRICQGNHRCWMESLNLSMCPWNQGISYMRSLRLVRVSRVLRLLRAIRVIRELRMMVFSIMSSLNVTELFVGILELVIFNASSMICTASWWLIVFMCNVASMNG